MVTYSLLPENIYWYVSFLTETFGLVVKICYTWWKRSVHTQVRLIPKTYLSTFLEPKYLSLRLDAHVANTTATSQVCSYVSNYRLLDCLLNRLILCEGHRWIPSQRTINVKSITVTWRHHGFSILGFQHLVDKQIQGSFCECVQPKRDDVTL